MQIPLNNIIEKIKTEANLTEEEIKSKINHKMDELAGLVSQEGAAHIVANELNIKLFDAEPQNIKIKDIKPFMKNLSITAKITNKFDLIEFERNSKPGKVQTCIIGDETGKIRSSFWHGATDAIKDAKVGDILQINKITSKENNGRTEISVSFEDQIKINPEGITIDVSDVTIDPKITKIAELGEAQYGTIMGSVVQIFKPNYFYSCPECRKKVKDESGKSICEEHGEITPSLGYVLNLFVDDGTEIMRVVLFNEQVDKFTEKNNDFFKEIKSNESEFEKVKTELMGDMIKVVGRIRFNSFSNQKELVASKLEKNIDIKKELEGMK